MTDRDRLVELLEQGKNKCYSQECEKCNYQQYWEIIADHLIANGVTVPVWCCDCKHSKVNPDIEGTCYLTCSLSYGMQGIIDPTDFCSYGKLKENGNE